MTHIFMLMIWILSAAHMTAPQDHRSQEIENLTAVLRDPATQNRDTQAVLRTIERLGELKAAEAIDDLIPYLTFEQKFGWERSDMINEIQPIHAANRYPAVSALFQIGKPALPALIKVIRSHPSESLLNKNAVETVLFIFRTDLSAGIAYLENQGKQDRNVQSKQRLALAAERLRAVQRLVPKK